MLADFADSYASYCQAVNGFEVFPERLAPGVSEAEITAFLLAHHGRGYHVVRRDNGVELDLDSNYTLRFNGSGRKCQVQLHYLGNNVQGFLDVFSTAQLQEAVDRLAVKAIGSRWRTNQVVGRLSHGRSATNNATIAGLIGSSVVEALFDPYLTNEALVRLTQVLSFGAATVGEGVRALSTSNTTGGQLPRLTRAGFAAWTHELGINGEIRVMPPSEHRRFLLLSGDQSLLLGASLNSIDKNEAVRLEEDTDDRPFFEQVWAQATTLS